MKLLSISFLAYLVISNALPLHDSGDKVPVPSDGVEDYELLSDLLTIATQLDDEDLDEFLEADVTENAIELFNSRGRHKRELPKWSKVLLKCTVHYIFPQLELYHMIEDVETLVNKGRDVKTIIDELSIKYENMEKGREEGRPKRSVEEIKMFFQDSCVQDAIQYGIKNREKIKCALKKSVAWAKARVKKLRESEGWARVKSFFKG